MLRLDFITLFPEMVLGALEHSVVHRAADSGLVRFSAVNSREFAKDKHRTVDEKPYGGGPGMLMKADVLYEALASLLESGKDGGKEGGKGGPREIGKSGSQHEAAQAQGCPPSLPPPLPLSRPPSFPLSFDPSSSSPSPPRSSFLVPRSCPESLAILIPDPTGRPYTQADAHELSAKEQVIILCGHYEGIDHRIYKLATHVVSIGDFILTGGELPALVIADSIVRLLPGALGCSDSLNIDSHSDGLLSAPQFTRPETFLDESVPEVLKSGDHQAVERWKRQQALKLTRSNRPDLFCKAKLEKRDLDLLSS